MNYEYPDDLVEQDGYNDDPSYRIKTEYPDDDSIGIDDYNQEDYSNHSRSSLREYANTLMKSNGEYDQDYSKSNRSRQSLKIKEEYPYDDGYYPMTKIEQYEDEGYDNYNDNVYDEES